MTQFLFLIQSSKIALLPDFLFNKNIVASNNLIFELWQAPKQKFNLSWSRSTTGGEHALPHSGVEHQVLNARRPHCLDAASAGPRTRKVVPATGRVGEVPWRGAHRLRPGRQLHRRGGRG